MLTEAQKRAKKKWREKNRAKERYYSDKAAAKRFIKEAATPEDLSELQEEISKKLLENG